MRVSEQRSEQLRDSEYADHYNKERLHKGLDYRRPSSPNNRLHSRAPCNVAAAWAAC
jgi:hypothetical protein